MRAGTLLCLGISAGISMMLVPASAGAAVGDLAYQGCLTTEAASGGTSGTGACKELQGTQPGGDNSGLDGLRNLTMSSDGKFLYAVGSSDSAIAWFKRDKKKGKLSYKGCVTGDTASGPPGPCTAIPSAAANGVDSGLADVRALAISPDGKWLYGASFDDDAVSRFKRSPKTGKLTFKNCTTGELETGPGPGTGACLTVPSATSGGANSGLDGLRDIAVSSDGTSVYAASENDNAVVDFHRHTTNGTLDYDGCITGETDSSPACTAIPSAAAAGANSGLDDLFALDVSPDAKSLYAVAADDDAIARFARDRDSGDLTYRGCITGEGDSGSTPGSGACADADLQTPTGASSGLDAPVSVTVTHDGSAVYVATAGDDSVVHFNRAQNGSLVQSDCMTGNTSAAALCNQAVTATDGGSGSGMRRLRDVAVSRDGKSIYAVSDNDDAITTLRIANGILTYRKCITGNLLLGPTPGSGACNLIPSGAPNGTNTGLDSPQAAAVSADGKSVYTASLNDVAIGRFKRAR